MAGRVAAAAAMLRAANAGPAVGSTPAQNGFPRPPPRRVASNGSDEVASAASEAGKFVQGRVRRLVLHVALPLRVHPFPFHASCTRSLRPITYSDPLSLPEIRRCGHELRQEHVHVHPGLYRRQERSPRAGRPAPAPCVQSQRRLRAPAEAHVLGWRSCACCFPDTTSRPSEEAAYARGGRGVGGGVVPVHERCEYPLRWFQETKEADRSIGSG